jgi:hypothetical protein
MVFQLPPIEVASIQSAVLAATSNLLAQVITSFRHEVCELIATDHINMHREKVSDGCMHVCCSILKWLTRLSL